MHIPYTDKTEWKRFRHFKPHLEHKGYYLVVIEDNSEKEDTPNYSPPYTMQWFDDENAFRFDYDEAQDLIFDGSDLNKLWVTKIVMPSPPVMFRGEED